MPGKFCEDCGAKVDAGERFCSDCGASLGLPSQPEQRAPSGMTGVREEVAGADGTARVPFENRRNLGFWNAFWQTWVFASTQPDRIYPFLWDTRDTWSGAIFFLIVGLVSLLISLLPVLMIFGVGLSFLSVGIGFLGILYVGLMVAISLPAMLIGTYLGTFIFHLALQIVGGGPKGFSTTLRTVYYASAPSVVPFIGPLWAFVMAVIGLAQAHRVEVWRPIVALFLSFVVMLGGFLILGGIFAAIGGLFGR